MVEMTYDEYDQMLEKFELIKEKKRVPVFWPTLQQIDGFREKPEEWLVLCCYLYECNPKPKTQSEKYSKSNLSMFINEHLVLVDPEEKKE